MISRNEFKQIDALVKTAIEEVYSKITQKDDYIVFLAFGDYDEYSSSPYFIDSRMDGFKDKVWLQVLLEFLNIAYNFNTEKTSDTEEGLFIEKMMYLHIWESRPYLKHLKRIANLIDKNDYLWKNKVKNKTKAVFLSNQVLPIFN